MPQPAQPGTDWIGALSHSYDTADIYLPSSGTRAGVASDGVLVGSLTPTAVTKAFTALTGGTVFVDITTGANDAATANAGWNLAAAQDALYVAYTAPFSGLKVTYSTAGDESATTLWEYYNGTTWVNLATSDFLLDSSANSGAFKVAASTKFITWRPPSAWAKTTVNSAGPYYWVRVRVSAFTSLTTAPALDQIWVLPLKGAGKGLPIAVNGQVTQIAHVTSTTLSGSSNDTKLLIINVTSGNSYLFTATKHVAASIDTAPTLFGSLYDQIVVQCVQGDGSTEFAGSNLRLIWQPLS